MILYACLVRLQDGLPLSASTDFHPNMQILECKRWVKRLSVTLSQRPSRGTTNVCNFHIHFLSSGDISSLVVCSSTYPPATAFSFLEELVWEFSASYNSTAIALASRPYAFLEFDSVIQRVKHNFNSAGSSPRDPLDPTSPPVYVKLEDIGESNGFANGHVTAQVHAGVNCRMSPVSPLGILSLTLSIMCAALSLIRGVHLAEHSFQDGYENSGRVVAFLTAFSATISQCYLYLFYSPARTGKALGLVLVIGLCNTYLYGLRNAWQILFHVFVAFLSAHQIVHRKPLDRHGGGGA
ncbi:PREDICTED: vesicle-trafficking protein SEC22c [Nanorana parkeri]|uniref:vesicle-trafficking protein SEC22c n=1 Tax=Nanorana parkeri TaxID=125878 RepID=UPI000854E8AA|nr:PREDICTED: vesicle-trafficking protein SEC22c [Nanorana parkeri]